MRRIILFLCLGVFFFASCEEPPSSTNNSIVSTPSTNNTSTKEVTEDTASSLPTNPARLFHDCDIAGKVLKDNEIWIQEKELLVCIAADSTTLDPDFGESHRRFLVYNTSNCELIHEQTLPVNNSPDFPYYLSQELQDGPAAFVCCQGFDFTFCYDLNNKKSVPKLTPKYLSEREAQDAQSGMPMGLKMQGNFLFGLALNFGAFAFDLSNPQQPKALLPAAEFPMQDRMSHSSLFFIDQDGLSKKAIIPGFDEEESSVVLKKVFPSSDAVTDGVSKNVRNNRFIVLEDLHSSMGKRRVVDMIHQEEVKIPNEIAVKPVQEVLQWIRKNVKN